MASYRLTVEGEDVALLELVTLAMKRGLAARLETLPSVQTPPTKVTRDPKSRLFEGSGGGGTSEPPSPDIVSRI